MSRIWRGLTHNRAETDPASPDVRLRGRTYAISFDRVWTACHQLAGGGLRGWSIEHADDQTGKILAVSRSLLFPRICDVRVRVSLDEDAQTRVDVDCVARETRRDLGRSSRTIRRFVRALDRALEARPGQILDPRIRPPWAAT